jgi:hypothetical protein
MGEARRLEAGKFVEPGDPCGQLPGPDRARGGCGKISETESTVSTAQRAARGAQFSEVLARLGLRGDDLKSFVSWLEVAIAVKADRRKRHVDAGDILTLIEEARDAKDLDEAVWRAFLAAHFGRTSIARGERDSAFELLCGFTKKPLWTWSLVFRERGSLRAWLGSHRQEIEQLTFGNHRKRRSKFTVAKLWAVLESFLDAVERAGGSPAKWMATGPDAKTDQDRFHKLYCRVVGLLDFGRLGAYDFVELLSDLGIASAEPGTCYLQGATGPLAGARRIWPGRPPHELDQLAAQLARDLEVSPAILEDALCNWQKK